MGEPTELLCSILLPAGKFLLGTLLLVPFLTGLSGLLAVFPELPNTLVVIVLQSLDLVPFCILLTLKLGTLVTELVNVL